MQFHEQVRDAINNHKAKIELMQWAIISGIGSLIYCEYLKNMKHNIVPVEKVFIAEIKQLRDLLAEGSPFCQTLQTKFIDLMLNNPKMKEYIDAPELILFKEKPEVVKTIFDIYILKNISDKLPSTFQLKFGIGNPKNQMIYERNDIDIFNRQIPPSEYIQFMADQSVLHLLTSLPTISKDYTHIEENARFKFEALSNEILVIKNENELTPIYLDDQIIDNHSVMKLIEFITSLSVRDRNRSVWKTNPFNKIAIIRLGEIAEAN